MQQQKFMGTRAAVARLYLPRNDVVSPSHFFPLCDSRKFDVPGDCLVPARVNFYIHTS
jgi:hypothetical protein